MIIHRLINLLVIILHQLINLILQLLININ